MSYDSNDHDARLRVLHAELSSLLGVQGPGLAKAPSRRELALTKALSKFRAGVDYLVRKNWTRAKIADYIGVHPVTLKDWYEQGDVKRSQIPGWVFAAMPPESREAMVRAELNWADPPPASRTGTEG
jgi:hypothetical protein